MSASLGIVSRYPDGLIKDTLEMDILVTDILVTGHFGKTNKYTLKAYLKAKVVNTGFAGSKSVYTLVGQCLLT